VLQSIVATLCVRARCVQVLQSCKPKTTLPMTTLLQNEWRETEERREKERQSPIKHDFVEAARHVKRVLKQPGLGSLYGKSRLTLSPKRRTAMARALIEEKGIASSGLGA
jgi:hypothetical protein